MPPRYQALVSGATAMGDGQPQIVSTPRGPSARMFPGLRRCRGGGGGGGGGGPRRRSDEAVDKSGVLTFKSATSQTSTVGNRIHSLAQSHKAK